MFKMYDRTLKQMLTKKGASMTLEWAHQQCKYNNKIPSGLSELCKLKPPE